MSTIPHRLLNRVALSSSKDALACIDQGGLHWMTWSELRNVVADRTRLLERIGIGRGDFVVHVGTNSLDWIFNDLAIQFAGAVHVPFHALSTSKQIVPLLEHCRPQAIIVDSVSQWQKLPHARLENTCAILGSVDATLEGSSQMFRDYREAKNIDGGEFLQTKLNAVHLEEQDLISILYTSGTTGQSKGVMLSQKNVVSNVAAKLATLPLTEIDIRLCILPMSHIFARVCDIYTWIESGSRLVISRGREFVMDELQMVRPTYLNAVPYYYEKFWRHLRDHEQLELPGALANLLGGRIRLANCGGAAIADHVFDYYRENQVELVTGYGLTETSPVISSNRPSAVRRGTVGQAVPGVEIRIASDGEVLARGDNVMQGYFQDQKLTDLTIQDGWLYTGDIGELDAEGFLSIIGRKKELIVTKGGKNISPVYIESLLNEDSVIAQSMVVGDHQDFLTALIVIDEKNFHGLFPKASDVNEQVKRLVERRLANESPNEQVQAILIADEPFSIDNEMLTAKSSLRREKIMEVYGVRLKELYDTLRANKSRTKNQSSYSSGNTS